MEKNSYRIKYELILNTAQGKITYPDKEIIVRRKENDLWAKRALKDYLMTKYGDKFVSLKVISCEPEFDILFESLFGRFPRF